MVGTAGDGAQAVTQTAALHPDVVLMDLHMPVMDGIAATGRGALVDVAAGRTHLDPAVQQRLVATVLANPPNTDLTQPTPGSSAPDGLTNREIEVLRLIAGGLSNTEIARTLVLSNATIKSHINHIFAKTGVRDRGQAVRYAYEHGLPPGP